PRCGPPPTRWPAMRSAPSCWKSGGRRTSSISSPAASSHWPRQPPASPPCCCGWRRSRGPRPRKPDGSCARHIRRRLRPGTPGARLFSTRNWFVTVMARSAAGSWNGNVMSASSANRRRILSLWLPRLPIDRIKRKLLQNGDAPGENCKVVSSQVSLDTNGALPPPLRGRAGERGGGNGSACGLPLSLTLPRKGGGNDSGAPVDTSNYTTSAQAWPSVVVAKQHNAILIYALD